MPAVWIRGRDNMSSTISPDGVICPDCGSTNLAESTKCFICGQSLAPADTGTTPNVPLAASLPAKDLTAAAAGFDLSGPVLVIALVILCVGIGFEEPGLGIGLAVALTPALIRTLHISSEKRRRGAPLTALELAATGFGSLLVVVTVGVAAAATFYGVCWAGFVGGALASSPFFKNYEPIGYGLVAGGIAGTTAGVCVAVILIRRLWPGKKN